MRIVDLYKMSEDEKKKILEEQNARLEQRRRESEKIQIQANDKFNNSIANKGEYDTTKHTFNKSIIEKPTIWDKIGYTASSFLGGGLTGTTGIAQGGLTDFSNQAKKGSDKSWIQLVNQGLGTLSNITNPTGAMVESQLNYNRKFINTLGNKEKSTWQKVVDLALNSVQATKEANPLYGAYSSTAQTLGKINPEISEKTMKINQEISKPSKDYNQFLANESQKYDDATNFVAGGFQSVGNMTPSIIATAITKDPNIGLATMGMSVKGQATQEALDKGQDLETAVKIGDAKALVEIATEKISGGAKLFGKGSIDDLTDELVKKGPKSKVGKFLLKQFFNTVGEIGEEEISNLAGNIIDKGTTEPDKRIVDWKEGLETMRSTAFTTNLLNLLTRRNGK